MPGLWASLNVGLSGLQAQQAALNVVGHNIANVNTPGYSRQRADMVSNASKLEGQVYFGTGVSLNSVQGLRDRYLDLQLSHETSKQAGADERYAGVNAVATAIGDTGSTGLDAQIQGFFQAFQDLSAKPEDTALRQNVVGKANTMINGLKASWTLLETQRSSENQAVGGLLTQVNTLTDQIAQLNKRVLSEPTPGSDNDARDQRTVLTNKLAALVGINVTEDAKGSYQITLDSGAGVLVGGISSYSLTTTPTDVSTPGPWTTNGMAKVYSNMGGTSTDVTTNIKEGQLGAKLELRDTTLVGYQQQLDQVAAGIAAQVNQKHNQGYGINPLNPGQGLDFFQYGNTANQVTGLPPGISNANGYKGMILNLAVNDTVAKDPSRIAISKTAPAAGVIATGDNQIALAIGQLQFSTATVDTNKDGTGDTSYTSALGSMIGGLGTDAQTYQAQSSTQQNLVLALQTQRDRTSGVDLDEEAANMMTLQRGYQASARFLSVINQLTDELVNQFGK
jgi:flagellar hook-associated protein 1 FlgK